MIRASHLELETLLTTVVPHMTNSALLVSSKGYKSRIQKLPKELDFYSQKLIRLGDKVLAFSNYETSFVEELSNFADKKKFYAAFKCSLLLEKTDFALATTGE